MTAHPSNSPLMKNKAVFAVLLILLIIGISGFLLQLSGEHPQQAWQAYLINFLFWSGVAQGGLLFSVVMHLTKARWSGPLQSLSDSFVAFFPISFVLFLVLFLGREHVFPWIHEDLHGKEVWLNIPFLFWRDFVALLVMYGIGGTYVFFATKLKRKNQHAWTNIPQESDPDYAEFERCRSKMSLWGVFYVGTFFVVLTLIGFDLVMSMDPHWYSNLFGAYIMVKSFYIGLGGLLILAAVFCLSFGDRTMLTREHFHDLSKLFFAFCLVWADFFYVQFLVIWYGNIPEETHYVIVRTMLSPWKPLAWTVFGVCFILPFFLLLNKNFKTKPVLMMILSLVVLTGIWFEYLLLLGPALQHSASSLPVAFSDAMISLGFLALMGFAVMVYLTRTPGLIFKNESEVSA